MHYVNVVLSDPSNSSMLMGKSFEGGKFELSDINHSHFLLKISSLGYEEHSDTIEMHADHIDLGQIVLSRLVMEEVVVKGNRPLIEQSAEGIIFNVAGSYYEHGLNGVELLSRTPNLQISNNNVNVVGRSGILVLINGKETHMSGQQLVAYVRSLRSEDISRIIVSTNPSAKYDAQGNSGIVNIILNRREGFNADMSFDYIRSAKNTYIPALGISYSNDKVYANLNVSSFWQNQVFESDLDYIYDDYIRKTDTERTDISKPNLYIDLSLDYKLSGRSNIGVMTSYAYNDSESHYVSRTTYKRLEGVYSSIDMPSNSEDKSRWLGVYPYWDYSFGTSGKTLKLEGSYVKSISESEIALSQHNYRNNFEQQLDGSYAVNKSHLDYDLYSIKGDLTLPFGEFGKTELGVKSTFIRNHSERLAYNSDESFTSIRDPQEDGFGTNEDIHAIYLTHSAHLVEKLELRAGLRYEYAVLENTQAYKNKNGHLFPSATLAYAVSDDLQTSIGYNKRLNRPSILRTNPFRWYTSSIDYSTGNSQLNPELMHNMDLGLSYKNLSTSIYWSYLIDGIESVREEDPHTGGYVSYPMNTLKESKFGINLNYYLMSIKNFGALLNASFYLNALSSSFSHYLSQSGKSIGGSLMINPRYTLSSKLGNSVEMIFMYDLPEANDIRSTQSFFLWGVKYKHPFFNNSFWVSINLNDPFKWSKTGSKTIYSDYTFKATHYNDFRAFKISLSYNINNSKMRNSYRNVDRSDESRIR